MKKCVEYEGNMMKEFTGYKKGINLGGWLSQCGNDYTEDRYQNYIVESDFAKIASWGLDHVRIPIDYNVIQNEDGSFIETGFAHVDRALEWCDKYGLNAILDIHKAKGFVFDDKNYCSFFTDTETQGIFIKLWREIAHRYGERKNVAFELLNEVTSPDFAKPWNEIIAKTVPAIREIAPDTRIIVGGIYNNSIYGLTLMDQPVDENMVFTFHCYSPFVFTHQKAAWVEKMTPECDCVFPLPADEMREASKNIFGMDFDAEFEGLGKNLIDSLYFKKMFEQAIQVAEEVNVPLYCGEYGVIDQADCESTVNWYREIHKALEECNISRAAWTYKEMDFGITTKHLLPVMNDIIELL